MKRLSLVAASLAMLCLAAQPARATEVGSQRKIGFGFQIGEPTALTAKAFLGGGNALDFGLGFAGYGWCGDGNGRDHRCGGPSSYLSFHSDYLYQENLLLNVNRLDWYVGLGGRVVTYGSNSGHDMVLIGRVPVGLAVTFHRPDFIELYLELAPGMVVFPYLALAFDLGLGVRAYF